MIEPDWRSWTVALTGALMVHSALAIGVAPRTSGSTEKPAGTPVSVAGSLASVLGANVLEATEQNQPVKVEPVEVEPVGDARAKTVPPIEVDAPPPRDVQPAPVEPLQAADPVNVQPAMAPNDHRPVTARSQSQNGITNAVARKAIEITSLEQPPAPEIIVARTVRPEPTKQDKTRAARRRDETRQQKARHERLVKRRQAEQQRRAARRAQAGSNREGAAGATQGGRGGRSRVSAGAVQSYGALVRVRILGNRPSASGYGIAVVSFGLSGGGALTYARLTRSSGNSSLDRAALSTVRRSSPFPRPPSGASTGQLRFTISFSFR